MSRVLDLFLELVALPTPPGRERAAADRCIALLEGLGLAVDEDGCGPSIDGDTGNLYVRLEPTAEGTPIFLCAHLDTVPVTGPIEPVVEDGVVRNRGDAILGADNKATVAGMIEGVRRVLEQGIPHAGIELVLTPQEEVGLRGAKAFDASRLVARCGFVYDHTGAPGGVITAAPSQQTIDLVFRGRAAHAGIAPEEGANAIVAAARAIAAMPIGRLDAGTTTNVGVIAGGDQRNVVAPSCRVQAEARSLDHARCAEVAQAIVDAAAAGAAEAGCSVDVAMREEYRAYRLPLSSLPGRIAREAIGAAGLPLVERSTGGGADAHVFNLAGIPCLNLCSGMEQVHTPDEHIRVDHLEQLVDLTVELVRAATRVV